MTKVNRPMGIIGLIAVVFLIVAFGSLIGVMFYHSTLENRISSAYSTISSVRDQLSVEFINDIRDLDNRLNAVNLLLSQHASISPFFNFIEQATLPGIEFNSFSFDIEEDKPQVIMIGRGIDYETIAKQSVVIGASEQINNHIFSDFILGDDGFVSFTLTLEPGEEIVLFEKNKFTDIDENTVTPAGISRGNKNSGTSIVIPTNDIIGVTNETS